MVKQLKLIYGYFFIYCSSFTMTKDRYVAFILLLSFVAGKPYFAQAQVEKKINIHIAPALETLDTMISQGLSGTFDFAFIDADKGNYINYYERCLVLLRKGGIIAVDNTIWSGSVSISKICCPYQP